MKDFHNWEWHILRYGGVNHILIKKKVAVIESYVVYSNKN